MKGETIFRRALREVNANPKRQRIADEPPSKVNLFVTCLVDQFAPNVGMSVVNILEAREPVSRSIYTDLPTRRLLRSTDSERSEGASGFRPIPNDASFPVASSVVLGHLRGVQQRVPKRGADRLPDRVPVRLVRGDGQELLPGPLPWTSK